MERVTSTLPLLDRRDAVFGGAAVSVDNVAALNNGFDIEGVFVVQNPVHLADETPVVARSGNIVLRIGEINH